MHSCIYSGYTEHHRRTPREHRFQYPITLLYLDLDEAPAVIERFRWLSNRKYAMLSFHSEDHGEAPAAQPSQLADAVRHRVAATTGIKSKGPIRLLTPLRHFGRYFSPLSLFYCFEETGNGESIHAVVGEVTNTPWREKHWYVLGDHNRKGANEAQSNSLSFSNPKNFHVSPFMEMGLRYQWKITEPAESLRVAIRSHADDCDKTTDASDVNKPFFVASVDLRREPLTDWRLLQMILRHPIGPLQTLAAIHFEAWRLWLKKVPYCPHPGPHENRKDQASAD